MPIPLLATKLFLPPTVKNLLGRPRLLEKMAECLRPGCRLTLVSAPAGFGKTTLVSGWAAGLRSTATRVAWLSLDDSDNDPTVFWRYLIAALQTRQAGTGEQALDLLQSMPAPDFESCLTALINDLARQPGPSALVLDDYHRIRNATIHGSLTYFVERLPPHFHLLIVSRTDPPLPLALLRGRGQLLEIRMNDLRLSAEDSGAFLNAGWGLELSEQAIRALTEKTEGWIAGLQMAALSLREVTSAAEGEMAERFVASFSGSNRYILDYLIEEVLNRQPAEVQRFLVRTAILDQLCGPLCDALLEGDEGGPFPGGQAALETLEERNLFIIPLDDRRYWYRYHHLFGELLQKRLSQQEPGLITALHRRAVDWYERNQLIPWAIEHALRGGDTARAAALVSQIAEERWGQGEHVTLLGWIDALPEEEKRRYPQLWVWQVSMLITAGRLKEAAACMPAIEGYIQSARTSGPGADALTGRLFSLRSYIASFYQEYEQVLQYAGQALAALSGDENAAGRCGVWLVASNAHLVSGDLAAAAEALQHAIEDSQQAGKRHMALTGMANLAITACLQGDWATVRRVCQPGLALIQQHGLARAQMAAALSISWGLALCEEGAPDEAEGFIQQGRTLAEERNYLWTVAWGCLALARLRLARGRPAEAQAALQQAEQLAGQHDIPAYYMAWMAALRARAWIAEGEMAEAERYLQRQGVQMEGEVRFPHEPEYLALARLALEKDDPARAGRLLAALRAHTEERGQIGWRTQALILQAALEAIQGDTTRGQQTLGEALRLAEPQDAVQVFVDEARWVAPLLAEAVRQGSQGEFARRILQACEAGPVPAAPGPGGLREPLSRREQEVLQLIAEGLANKEIAQRLSISVRTVKYYTTSLFTKLEVERRTQATARARELGLLP